MILQLDVEGRTTSMPGDKVIGPTLMELVLGSKVVGVVMVEGFVRANPAKPLELRTPGVERKVERVLDLVMV
jgi:hypothetical protein